MIKAKNLGYTFVEVMVVVALIAVISAGAYVGLKDVKENTQKVKLERDVATINNSIRLYSASGGSFVGVTDAAGAIAKLKTSASNGNQIAALRGSMVDQRLTLIMSQSGDVGPFAVWNMIDQVFRVDPTATSGVKEFSFGSVSAATSESRTATLKLNEDPGWVWAYTDKTSTPKAAPTSRPMTISSPPTPSIAQLSQLNPPVFTPSSPQPVLMSYPLSLLVGPGSSDQWTTVYKRAGDPSYQPFSSAFTGHPGDVFEAKKISLEPETFSDSSTTVAPYIPNPEDLVLAHTFPTSVTYGSLGGTLVTAAPPLTPTSKITLTTTGVIPTAYQNSSVFNVFWTLDGTSPVTSTTRVATPAFTNGYPGSFVPLTVSTFGTSNSLNVQYYAGSTAPFTVNSSPVYSQTILATKSFLEPPLITPAAGIVAVDATVTLTLNTAVGTLPPGTRIFYRTDGTDPGDSAGEPLPGATLWTGSTFTVTPTVANPVTVTCRAYPPTGLNNWFTTSGLASSTYSCAPPAAPPTFAPPPPVTGILLYPLAVTLNHPNDATYTEVWYSLSSAPATALKYTSPVTIQPGITINAYVKSTDLLHYRDSAHAVATYSPTPVTLVLGNNLANGYSFTDLGGPMAPGSPAVVAVTPGRITLTNEAAIPNTFENNANFRCYWTLDGTAPLFSGTRITGTSFTNGYPGDSILLTVADFGSASSLSLNYVADATVTWLNDSVVTTKNVPISQIALPPPLFTPLSGGDPSSGVTLAPDLASSKIPLGYRIYYRTDNTDPGVDATGDPNAGATLYNGTPITIVSTQTVHARCYPPSGYKNWFTSSADTSSTYKTEITTKCFGSDGTFNIYQFHPPSGGVAVLTSTALFPVVSVAYDNASDVIYYAEDAATNFRLAKYDITANTHTLIGSLTTPASGTWEVTPISRIQGLSFFAGKLFHILNGTDDLIRIDLNAAATIITNQVKIADITNGVKNFGNLGDLSTTADGRLWIAGEGELATFNLTTLSGYTSIRTYTPPGIGTPYYPSLVRLDTSDELFLNRNANNLIYRLDAAGAESTSVVTIPSILFNDMAGAEATISLPGPTSNFYAVTGGNKNIYQLDPVTGLQKLLDNTAPFNIGAIAYDPAAGVIYYLEDGSSATWRVGKYTVATNTHAASLGNLKTIGTNRPTVYPGNFVYYNNALYYIHPSSQNLVIVGLNAGATAISTQVNRSLGNTMQTIGDLALDDTGLLFWVNTNGGTHTLWQFELRNDAFVTNLGPAARAYPSLGFFNGVLYGAGGNGANIDSIDVDITPGTATAASIAQPNLTFVDFAAGSNAPPPSSVGTYYAISNASSRIYKFSPDSGTYTREPNACPFIPAAVAYDSVNNLVYYVELAATNWRVGRYNPATGIHTTLTNNLATSTSGWTPATSQPKHLLYYGGQLLFIDNNTDNLRRVEMLGNAITFIGPFAALNGGLSLGPVNAATIASDGYLYFATPSLFAKYSISTKSNYTVLSAAPASSWQALVFAADNLLYGIDATQTTISKVLNPTTGAGTFTANVQSARIFTDIAGKPPAAPPNPGAPGELIAARDTSLTLNRANPATGAVTAITDTALFQPYALGYDASSDTIYYTGGTAAGEFKLARYAMSSGVHTLLGDLRAAATYAYTPADRAENLLYFTDGLFYLAKGTDDLVKITLSGSTISSQIKVKDLANNVSSWTNVGGLTANNLGVAYFGDSSADFYGKFMLPDGSAYSSVSTTAPRTYAGLAIRSSDQAMFATRPAAVVGDLGRKFYTTATSTGALTFSANSTAATAIIDLADSVTLAGVIPNFYAVGGNSASIYKFDGANGNEIDWVSNCPFNIECVAVTADDARVYYIEKAASNWRLGEYAPATNTHTIRATLTDATYAYQPTAQPSNLTFVNGRLYYVAEGTDDLIAIEFSDTGAPVVKTQTKITDLNSNTPLTNIGDLAIDTAGTMFISASNAFCTWNYKTQSTFSILAASPTTYWTGLVATSDGKLLGVNNTEPTKLYNVNKTTGIGTYIATYSPVASFSDFAAPQPGVPLDNTSLTYFITSSGTSIYRVDLATGKESFVTSQVPINSTGITLDSATDILYLVGDDLAATGDVQLSRYDLTTGVNANLGSLKAGGLGYLPTAAPHNLAAQNGFLYYVAKNTDDLVKVTVGASSITAESKIWDIGVPNYDWDTLAIAADSSAYLSTRDTHYLARINLQLLTGPQVIKSSIGSDEGADYTALTFNSTGQMVGAMNHVNLKGYRANTFNGATTYLWDGSYNGGSGLPIMDLTSPYSNAPVSVGTEYATDGGPNIYLINLTTGTVTTLTTSAPFNLQTLAYDPASRVLYYTENASPNWRLGKYDLASSTHTILGNLDEPSVTGAWNYNPSARPSNLSFFAGNLYYIHSNTDDLIRIDLAGNAIANQNQIADITNGTQSLGIPGDITATSTGTLWIAAENELGTFDLNTLSNYTTKRVTTSATPAVESYYPGLQRDLWNKIYADRQGLDTKIYALDSAGVETTNVATNPPTNLIDYAGEENTPALPTPTVPFYAIKGDANLYQVNPLTGLNRIINHNVPYNVGALAFDSTSNALFYLEENSSATWRVGRYNVATDLHTLTLGDLKTTGSFHPTNYPGNLVFYNQALYYVHPASSDLVKVSLNAALDTIIEQTTVSLGGTSFINVGDLAVDDTGMLYFINTTAVTNTLYRYDLRGSTGLTTVATTTRAFPSLGFYGGTLYGMGSNGAIIESINLGTAAQTTVSTAQPNLSFIDFASGQSAPAPLSALFFAITNGNKNIYRLDPTTGANLLLNNTAAYNLGAIAYDVSRNYVYYLQDTTLANATWSVGRYDVATSTHALVGDLKPVTSGFSPAMVPKNLAYYNGALYFIVPGRDDLLKAQLDVSGANIMGITSAASLTSGLLTFADPGDISANDSGQLIFSNQPASGSSTLYRYDLAGGTGFGVIGTLTKTESALGHYQNGLYGSSTLQVDRLNQTNATERANVATTPALVFTDFGGPALNTPPSPSDDLWAIAGYTAAPDPHLIRFRNYKNANGSVERTDFGSLAFQDGASVTTFLNSTSVLAAMTVDAANRLYFINSASITIAGVVYNRPLFTVNLSGLPASGPVVATFVGDLDPGIRAAIGISPLTVNEVVSGLAPATDGLLRFVIRAGTGATTDSLCTVTSLTPDSFGNLTVALAGALANGGTTAGNAKGLTIDSIGQAYVSDLDDGGIYKLSATTGALTLPLYSIEPTVGPLAVHQSDTDLVTALPNSTITKVMAGSTNDTSYFNEFNLWGMSPPTAISFPGLAVMPFPAVSGKFAANGSSTLYRIDPITGANVAVTNAPFNVQSLAFDSASNKLYYVEAAASNWRVGRYDVTSNLHTIYNFNLTTPGGTNYTPITAQPENLFIADGGLYTIAPNTDDLIKIELTPIGIDSIFKLADLNGDVSQGAVTAATIDSNGVLYFASTARLAKFDLTIMSDYTLIASNSIPWSSLVFGPAGVLYGIRSDDPFKTFSINLLTGAPTLVAGILPKVAFTDISSTSGPYLPASGYAFSSIPNCPAILRTDLATAKIYFLTWLARGNVEAVAYDQPNGLVYYTTTSDSPQLLFCYDLLTNTHTAVRDALLQTDLKVLGTHHPTGTRAHHLTFFNGSLYYVATGTDDLYKITFTSRYVIADQVKVADIAGNTTVGNTVGGLTVDDTGLAYLSWEDSNTLARFDMRTLGGYTVIDSTPTQSRYYALTYDSSLLHGIPWDAAVSRKLYTLNVGTGARSLIGDINPINQIMDLATSTPTQPALPAPTANFFGIIGGTKSIYRLDPTTGQNLLLNNTAPYNLGAIAYDGTGGNIFYLEDGADATWNIGKYTVATSTHSATLGNVKSIATAATAYPGNLVYYNNALYYLQPGTSNLIKASLDAGATAITGQTSINLGTTFNTVGDLALNDAGMLYWVSTNAGVNTFYKYNLRDSTGFASIGSTTTSYPALGFYNGTLYGTGGNAFVIDSVNATSGAASIASTAQPNLAFTDFASGSTASLPALAVWSIAENGNAQLVKINGYDGSPTIVNYGDIHYPGSGGASTIFAVDSDIESLAITSDNFAYFVRNASTNVNSITYGRPLFRIDLSTATIGSVNATFLGDLDQALNAMNGGPINLAIPAQGVSALAVGTDGALYGVFQKGLDTDVDKLFKLTGLAVDGANNLTAYTSQGDITNGASNVGTNVSALEFTNGGTLYAFDAKDGQMLVLNPATAAVTSLHSTEAGANLKDLAINPSNNDFIASNFTNLSLQRVVAPGADTVFWSYNTSPPWGTPTFTDLPGIKFPARTFTLAVSPPANIVYACSGGNKDIYSLDLTTGTNTLVVNNTAAFNLSSLAYDPVQNTVFYLQDTATGYSLGSWQIASNVHTAIYNLTLGNNYNSSVKPTNLTWWGGYLYFIEPGTDDLIRITTSPTVATQQTKVRDLTANAVAFSSIGDLAVDDTGLMYFSAMAAGNSIFASFNLTTMSSYTKIVETAGTADYCESIVFGPDSGSGRTLYVARDAARTIIRALNTTTGAISSTSTATTPSLALFDTSDRHLNAPSTASAYYAVAGGTNKNIYQLDPDTGVSTLLTTAPANFDGLAAIAWDQANGYLYYIEETASNFELGRYSLDTNTHVTLGNLQGSYTYNPASQPTNLGFMRGGLYYIATGTDDLVRIDVSATGIINQLQIADLNSNVALTNAGDLTAGTGNLAYFTANAKLYSFNVSTLATASVVSTFTLGTPDALASNAAGTGFYGIFNPVAGGALTTSVYNISLAGAPGTFASTNPLAFRDLAGPDLSTPDTLATSFFIGGDFGASATSRRGIARLSTATGAVDPAFETGPGHNVGSEVKSILPVGNGQVLGAGTFWTFDGQPRTGLVRLNADGSVDSSFAPVIK